MWQADVDPREVRDYIENQLGWEPQELTGPILDKVVIALERAIEDVLMDFEETFDAVIEEALLVST